MKPNIYIQGTHLTNYSARVSCRSHVVKKCNIQQQQQQQQQQQDCDTATTTKHHHQH